MLLPLAQQCGLVTVADGLPRTCQNKTLILEASKINYLKNKLLKCHGTITPQLRSGHSKTQPPWPRPFGKQSLRALGVRGAPQLLRPNEAD